VQFILITARNFLRRLGNYVLVRLRHFLLNLLIWRSSFTKNSSSFEEFKGEPQVTSRWFQRTAIRALSDIEGSSFIRFQNGDSRLPLYNPSILKISESQFLIVATESNRIMSYRWGRRPRFVSGTAFASNLVTGIAHLDSISPGDKANIDFKPLLGMENVAADGRLFSKGESQWIVWNQLFREESGGSLFAALVQRIGPRCEPPHSRVLTSPFDFPIEKTGCQSSRTTENGFNSFTRSLPP